MDNISAACRRAGRDPGDVKLLAVTKQVPVETVRRAVELGLKLIGENRVQEARSKAAEGAYAGAALCMIGHLQSNKASLAARVFDQVHAIDSERIGAVLSKFRLLYNPGDPMPVLLEVNAGRDPARFGVMPEGAADLARRVLAMGGLVLKGLMAVAPGYGDERLARTAFRQLRELRDGLARQGTPEKNLEELSMGMSGDYQIAVEEGSTMVRIGTALFGPRR
jgi:hypothetical protein